MLTVDLLHPHSQELGLDPGLWLPNLHPGHGVEHAGRAAQPRAEGWGWVTAGGMLVPQRLHGQMFGASPNSLCRDAHGDSSSCRTAGKGNGERKAGKDTQSKINFWCLQWNHSKGPVGSLISSSQGTITYHFHAPFFTGVHQGHRSDNTNTKT